MNRRYVVAVIFLGIAACATSGPQSPTPVASAGSSATDSKPTTPAGQVEIVAIPEVPMVTDIPVRDEVICRMEKRTGSNRATRVCRTRSGNTRSAREGKEKFEVLRRSQVEY
jgi:hypothetical protein